MAAKREVNLVLKARNEAEGAIKSVTDALESLVKSQNAAGQSAQQNNSLIGKLGASLKALQAQAEGLKELGRLSTEFDKAAASVKRLEAASNAADDKLKKVRDSLAFTKGTQAGLDRFDAAKQQAYELGFALAEARKALETLDPKIKTAGQSLGALETTQAGVARSARTTAESIEAISRAILAQNQATRSAAAVGGGGAAATATASYRAQVQAVNEAREAWRAASAEATRLGREVASTVSPTEQLKAAQLLAAQAAREAQQAYQRQASTLAATKAQIQQSIAAKQALVRAEREGAEAAASAAMAQDAVAQRQKQAALFASVFRLETEQVNRALGGTATAAQRAAQGMSIFSDTSSRALSFANRLRYEFLSLAVSVVGFYSAISQIQGVVTAIRAVETATSRLNVAFSGDQGKIREELRFIQAEASRLGLSFNVLSQQYGKFAVATNQANFSAEATREIFQSVIVAARVNKATTEELGGTLLALEQIVSKGTVSMEELRRQLGDRLPGAFNLFANALGITTSELDALIRKGEVAASQETLLKFARELDEQFGGQLPQSLNTVTTEIDRFGNNVEQAQRRIGQGGFESALKELFQTLNEGFDSRAGRDFFLALGGALAATTRTITFFVQNMESVKNVLIAVASVAVASKIVQLYSAFRALTPVLAANTAAFLALSGAQQQQFLAAGLQTNALTTLGFASRAVAASFVQLAVAIRTTGASSIATAVSLAGLTTTLRAAAVAVGTFIASFGPIAAIAIVLGLLASAFIDMNVAVDDSARTIDEASRQLEAYEKEVSNAAAEQRDFNASLTELDQIEADRILVELQEKYEALADKAEEASFRVLDAWQRQNPAAAFSQQGVALSQLVTQYRRGELGAFQFTEALRQLYREAEGDQSLQRLILKLISTQNETVEAGRAMGRQAIVAKSLGGDISGLADRVSELGLQYDIATGRIRNATSALEAQANAEKSLRGSITNLQDRANELSGDKTAERAKIRAEDERVSREAILRATYSGSQEDISAAVKAANQLKAARDKQFADEDAKGKKRDRSSKSQINRQKEFNEDLAATIALSEKEREWAALTAREREIARAVFEAELKAKDAGVQISAAQIEAIKNETAATFDAAAAKEAKLEKIRQEIALRKLMGQEVSVQQRIEEEAALRNIDLRTKEGEAWAALQTQIYQREEAIKKLGDAVDDLKVKEAELAEARRTLNDLQKEGEPQEKIEAQVKAVEDLRKKLAEAKEEALKLAIALGDEAAIARIRKVDETVKQTKTSFITMKDIATNVYNGLSKAANKSVEAIAAALAGTKKWSEAWKDVGDAFRQFAAEFLVWLAKVIIQYLIIKALRSAGIPVPDMPLPTMHTGGIAGKNRTTTRRVDPSVLLGAPRFHSGGVAGLRNGEVAAILKRGEEVVTENNPRHINNAMKGGAGGGLKIINTFDPGEFLSRALGTKQGERALLNYMRANKRVINGTTS